ncbi:MAG: hypothetical protein Q8S31_06865, partial [Alphaproteobacteria bacterium]|nr:hypothetical protein [Alphaproteobacteria bacterium]
MKKIIAAFFAFTFCFSMSLHAGFKEAADLFERHKYDEAYDEFLTCYKANDLRGNAYLHHLILNDKIDAARKEFWSDFEFQKLVDTTCIRSEKSLQASVLYQEFLKQSNDLLTEKKINKKKKLEKSLVGLLNKLVDLHKESISHATLILINISENIESKKRFKLSETSFYYDYALEWHVDRDIYLSALQKGYLDKPGYETYKLNAQLLERVSGNGVGEFLIAKILAKKKLPDVESHRKVLDRWFIQAAHLGNKEALETVLEYQLDLIKKKNKVSDESYIRDSSILTCLYRASYDGIADGYYACSLGYNFDGNHKKTENTLLGIQIDNKKAIFWYKKAKEQGSYLGAFNYIALLCNKYKDKVEKFIDESKINDFINIINEILKIENDPSELNNEEDKKELSNKIVLLIEFIYNNSSFNSPSLLKGLNYVMAHGDIESKNLAKYLKATYNSNSFCEEKLTDGDCFRLYLSASKTCYLAMLELGCIYEHGRLGQEIDFHKSFEYYANAYNRMNILGLSNFITLYNLGMSYLNGQGCEKNYEQAYELLNKAYALAPNDKDVVDAMLRCCLFLGEKYNKKAYKFAVLAYKMNIPFGDFHYAICLLFGKGCSKDIDKAKEIINKYYNESHAIAGYLLGKIELIESSFENAKKYFDNFLLWADPNSDLDQSFVAEVKLFFLDEILDEFDASEAGKNQLQESNSVILNVEPNNIEANNIEDEYDESYIDYQQIIEVERQKSLDK